MKRYHQEANITERNWRNHINIHRQSNINQGKDPEDIACSCDKQKGRFRKKDAYDCGNPRCYMCHGDKLMEGKGNTKQKKRSDVSFREQLAEV